VIGVEQHRGFLLVLIMNNVHVGNYGVKESDVESNGVKVKGVIGRNLEEQACAIRALLRTTVVLWNNIREIP
ncbi:MAG: hypothetical protein EOO89_24330, partial [Pedobacter sp.]